MTVKWNTRAQAFVSQAEKILEKIKSPGSEKSIPFEALCNCLKRLGFKNRTNSSHRIFIREGVAEIVNLQLGKDGKAKPYQVGRCVA